MNPLFKLYLKDCKHFFSDRRVLALSFLVPTVMALIFGFTYSGFSGDPSEDLKIRIDVADNDQSDISGKITTSIENDDVLVPSFVSEQQAYKDVKAGKRSVALVIPAGFGEKLKKSEDVELTLLYDPSNQLENGFAQGKMQQVIFTADLGEYIMPAMVEKMLKTDGESNTNIQIAKFWVNKYVVPRMKSKPSENKPDDAGEKKSGNDLFSGSFDEMPVKIKSVQVVGQDVNVTAGYVQSVTSAMVMFLLFGISFGAGALLREKKSGTLKRLLTSPLTIEGILVAKLLHLMTIGLIQIFFMLLVGWLVFGLEIWKFPVQLLLMAVATALMASGLGIMLTGFAKTEEQVGMLTPLVIITISAIGGAMVPRFIMPEIMKKIGVISPVTWAVDGFHNVFWQHQGFAGMLPNFGILVGFSLVFLTIGSIMVRKNLKNG